MTTDVSPAKVRSGFSLAVGDAIATGFFVFISSTFEEVHRHAALPRREPRSVLHTNAPHGLVGSRDPRARPRYTGHCSWIECTDSGVNRIRAHCGLVGWTRGTHQSQSQPCFCCTRPGKEEGASATHGMHRGLSAVSDKRPTTPVPYNATGTD